MEPVVWRVRYDFEDEWRYVEPPFPEDLPEKHDHAQPLYADENKALRRLRKAVPAAIEAIRDRGLDNLAQEVRKVYDDALSEERPGGSKGLREQIEQALRSYRTHHLRYEGDGGGMQLVDVFSEGAGSIKPGKREVELLADEIAYRLVEERPGGSGEPVSLSDEDVEHARRWAENATPEQVAAAMREKMRLERRLRRSTPDGEGGER